MPPNYKPNNSTCERIWKRPPKRKRQINQWKKLPTPWKVPPTGWAKAIRRLLFPPRKPPSARSRTPSANWKLRLPPKPRTLLQMPLIPSVIPPILSQIPRTHSGTMAFPVTVVSPATAAFPATAEQAKEQVKEQVKEQAKEQVKEQAKDKAKDKGKGKDKA